jgi:hypothetical protein
MIKTKWHPKGAMLRIDGACQLTPQIAPEPFGPVPRQAEYHRVAIRDV